MTQYECAKTGQSSGKAYILKTTEGEELVGEEALFHPEADAGLGQMLADMAVRIVRLEEALEARLEEKDSDGQEDGELPAAAEEPQATAVKRAPRQRKAVD